MASFHGVMDPGSFYLLLYVVLILSIISGYSMDISSSPSRKKKWLEESIPYPFKGTSQKLNILLLLIRIGQNLVTWPNLCETQLGNAGKCELDLGFSCSQLNLGILLLRKKSQCVGKIVVFRTVPTYWASFRSVNSPDPSKGSGTVQELRNSCWIKLHWGHFRLWNTKGSTGKQSY